MSTPRDLFLIAGIPGTGKTWYGDKFARDFGFLHRDLENQDTLKRLANDPPRFIDELKRQNQNVIVTWGFVPDGDQTAMVLQLKSAGFKLIWFDGNRPAALREFIKRGTVPEEMFYLQMYRIQSTQVVRAIGPVIVDPFDTQGKFKPAEELLAELRRV